MSRLWRVWKTGTAAPPAGAVHVSMNDYLDVQVDDIEFGRDQVETLGGRWTGERYDHDEGVVTIMHDPEGHEFCLVQ